MFAMFILFLDFILNGLFAGCRPDVSWSRRTWTLVKAAQGIGC
jgi:hypothetical protein